VSTLLSVKETAEHFGVCPDTIRNWRHAGIIPADAIIEINSRTRRFDIERIEAYLRRPKRGRPSTPFFTRP